MSNSHAKLPKIFWIQLALAAIIGIIFLLTPSKHGGSESGASTEKVESVAKNLASIGTVAVNDKTETAGASKARSGEEVYKASCQSCHATGIANAPKLDDKAAWEPRIAAGFDAIMDAAINGKGAMPARGGNPAITDEEIKATVLYMTDQAGFDLKSEQKTEEKPTLSETDSTVTEKVTPVVAVSPSTPSAPVAPNAPKTTKAPELNEADIASTIDLIEKTSDNKEGEQTYKKACFACHDMGVAGSPKLGDKAAWTSIIAKGNEAIYHVALNGKGAMPAKGGNMSLSDDAVKAAVDYMIANSQ